MCGIAGIVRRDGQLVQEDRLRLMAQKIAHRGPDGEGIWIEDGVGFAHRRLAIIDLSSRGAQPMVSIDERYVITFNGEIYNYRELRVACELSGSVFRSDSDTEVLLHLYARKGEKMLMDVCGMFAFALWDRKEQRLFVARDRVGKKPFFYKRTSAKFSFASELKALTIDEKPDIDWRAVRVFLGLQYVPSPLTGFVGIESLPPGYAGTLDREGVWHSWKYDDVFQAEPFTGSFVDAKDRLRILLEEAVKVRLVSDVPLGAFLSGGVDSSAITTFMVRHASTPVATFTMGFPTLGFDERVEAADLAQRLGTEHHAFEMSATQVAEMVDTMVDVYDAPYADSSGLPTWLLARETSKHVKVVLTGDGADELFAGYRRHAYFVQAMKLARVGAASLTPWMVMAGQLMHDHRFVRFARMLHATNGSPRRGYASLFTGAYFSAIDEASLLQSEFAMQTSDMSTEAWMMRQMKEEKSLSIALDFDRASYLPDDLNVKMDRATMAHGLEARAPFLDQNLVRFVASLPTDWLFAKGRGKYLLKEALKGIVPDDVLSRRKRGFQVPLARWFRGDLRGLFEERCLSDESPLIAVCQSQAIERLWKENDEGVDHGNRLWMLLVLATWLQKQKH